MFPHEEFLKKALEETTLHVVVRDLSGIYLSAIAAQTEVPLEDFQKVLKVTRILDEAADKLADLAPLPRLKHPMDTKHEA